MSEPALAEPVDETPEPRRRVSWRLAAWLAVLIGLLVWGALQPPTRLEPVDWVGTLDV